MPYCYTGSNNPWVYARDFLISSAIDRLLLNPLTPIYMIPCEDHKYIVYDSYGKVGVVSRLEVL